MKTDWKGRALAAEAELITKRSQLTDSHRAHRDIVDRNRRDSFRARIFRGLRLWPTRYRLVLRDEGCSLIVWHDAEHCSWALRRVLGPIFRLDRELWLR